MFFLGWGKGIYATADEECSCNTDRGDNKMMEYE